MLHSPCLKEKSYSAMPQLVIFTDSYDTTTDLLIKHLSSERHYIFRLNYDLLDSYSVTLSFNSFNIVDPIGRIATLSSVTKFLYRKPNRKKTFSSELARYVESENWAAMRFIINLLWESGKIVLVEPYDAMIRLDKLTQLRIASKLFKVPESSFCLNVSQRLQSHNLITKSLSGMWLGQRLLYATKVDTNSLDNSYPWFYQELIDAEYDLTVVYIRGNLFAFRLNRSILAERGIIDWKQEMGDHGLNGWSTYHLSNLERNKIKELMMLYCLDYGRLDFLINNQGELVFLEVNPNGQFAWLDFSDNNRVLTSYCSVIDPSTETTPLSWSPYS